MKNILLRIALVAISITQFQNQIVAQEAAQQKSGWFDWARGYRQGPQVAEQGPQQNWWQQKISGPLSYGWRKYVAEPVAKKWEDPGPLYDEYYGELLTRSKWLQNRNTEAGYENDPQWYAKKITGDVKSKIGGENLSLRDIYQRSIPSDYLETAIAYSPEIRGVLARAVGKSYNPDPSMRVPEADRNLIKNVLEAAVKNSDADAVKEVVKQEAAAPYMHSNYYRKLIDTTRSQIIDLGNKLAKLRYYAVREQDPLKQEQMFLDVDATAADLKNSKEIRQILEVATRRVRSSR
ncbi:MAG: hypothetical protein WC707_06095 [Candidatus Babeliaceae bacterium]